MEKKHSLWLIKRMEKITFLILKYEEIIVNTASVNHNSFETILHINKYLLEKYTLNTTSEL